MTKVTTKKIVDTLNKELPKRGMKGWSATHVKSMDQMQQEFPDLYKFFKENNLSLGDKSKK